MPTEQGSAARPDRLTSASPAAATGSQGAGGLVADAPSTPEMIMGTAVHQCSHGNSRRQP